MSFYTQCELEGFGFKFLGKQVKLSRKVSIYGSQYIELDDYCRIDDFCILSAGVQGIRVGKYVHIAVYCSLIGVSRIELDDFSGLSSRVSIYSSSDDYSGVFLTNPTVPVQYTNVQHGNVYLGRHVIVGAGSIILPDTVIDIGAAIGAMSLVTGKNYSEFMIYAGVPAKEIKPRKRNLLNLETEMLNKLAAMDKEL